jgi:hypothetical protein
MPVKKRILAGELQVWTYISVVGIDFQDAFWTWMQFKCKYSTKIMEVKCSQDGCKCEILEIFHDSGVCIVYSIG